MPPLLLLICHYAISLRCFSIRCRFFDTPDDMLMMPFRRYTARYYAPDDAASIFDAAFDGFSLLLAALPCHYAIIFLAYYLRHAIVDADIYFADFFA